MKLEELKRDLPVFGILPDQVVRIHSVDFTSPHSASVIFRRADGSLGEQLLFRSHESRLQIVTQGRPWSFSADAEGFKLAAEALRIDLAYLFDPMMAVHTSDVTPLPHQITAVYEHLLPRQPLRFVLADDPGAGKTIMAGLYIKELIARADARRIIIVAPGSLVQQWQDELFEKFGLTFALFSNAMMENTATAANPFEQHDLLICRVDQLARNEELQEKLKAVTWDLTVVDEAHKCAASWKSASEISKTQRFKLIEQVIGPKTRHLLLMTATPHNGKDEDFQLFLSLLDSDRFYGRVRDGAHKVDTTDLMRRMIKEDLVKFDGTPLFPERRAYTLNYKLSDTEALLYEAVTNYVRTEMNRAESLDGKKKAIVGFALTTLQRRLASSPFAIHQSLRRRRERLENDLREQKLSHRVRQMDDSSIASLIEDADDLDAEEQEDAEEKVVDTASAAANLRELELEIAALRELEAQAASLALSNTDRKWEQLSEVLQSEPEMRDADGNIRKLIIFTEHRDTLTYLKDKLSSLLGSKEAIVTIDGSTKREDRRKAQVNFRNDPVVRILVATDAAGEGVNLQTGNLMVNYDLPWNPNRLEQRFGRVHRIGQTRVCHLWNLVAAETREGEVYNTLLNKLEEVRIALKGRVFDILGELFEDRPLREILINAIRYGNQPERQADLLRKVGDTLELANIEKILHRESLDPSIINQAKLTEIRDAMDRAEAAKLQPFYIRSFFDKAFKLQGGELRSRESGRYEIRNVPATITERDRLVSGRHRNSFMPIPKRYERICFEKQAIRIPTKPDAAAAELIHAGHPMMQALIDLTLESSRALLAEGAIFLAPDDIGTEPSALLMLDHKVLDGHSSDTAISRRLAFLTLSPEGEAKPAGVAPHLDLVPFPADQLALIQDILAQSWLSQELETTALRYAAAHIAPAHTEEVHTSREAIAERTLNAVHSRLTREIQFWDNQAAKFRDDIDAGKEKQRGNLTQANDRIKEIKARLHSRSRELEAMRHIASAAPTLLGAALVIPQGLLNQRQGMPPSANGGGFCQDPALRAEVEAIAMRAVTAAEEAKGFVVTDVSMEKCGWDLTSRDPNNQLAPPRHLEVKGRSADARDVTVTRNEILQALNQGPKFILAIVLVSEGNQIDGPYFVPNPFTQEPDWHTTSMNLDIKKLLEKANK